MRFLENIPRIKGKLETLRDVGLGYIKLGQSATTLSGGEAQRVKLAKELGKRATGRTIYILDEPTTGLHFADIQKLLDVLQRLVEAGNTVVIIEHNLDVIKTADHVIDLGPEGGQPRRRDRRLRDAGRGGALLGIAYRAVPAAISEYAKSGGVIYNRCGRAPQQVFGPPPRRKIRSDFAVAQRLESGNSRKSQ